MDLPLVSFQLKENYLLVIGHGRRDTLLSMTQASAMIYEKVLETDRQYLLVDYRQLQINVHFSEAFNIVKRYEAAQPGLKSLKIAAVFAESGSEFGHYWREVSRQRGFFIEIFTHVHEAEAWLLKQIADGE
ncbi:MAG: hypothetical protein DI538_03135 [Azospira oryzae]|jgi:hypothetical protein|nr:MAG: hypothetical protein DI538_03135 [Azospira oryzae]